MHIITRSPLSFKRTELSFGGGERDVLMGTFLHSNNYENHLGYRISGQYYKGRDWESYDPYSRFRELQKKDPVLRTIVELFGAELEY